MARPRTVQIALRRNLTLSKHCHPGCDIVKSDPVAHAADGYDRLVHGNEAGGDRHDRELRRRVLDTAVALIADEGVEHVSMRRIAREAGVSHQAPYHHFGDRAGVFAAINEEAFELLATRLDAHLTNHFDDPPGELAAGCVRIYVEAALEHSGHFRVMFRQDLCNLDGHPAGDAALRAFGHLRRLVISCLGPDAAPPDVDGWVMTIWSLSHGLATLLVEMSLDAPLPDITAEQHIDNVAATVRRLVESALVERRK